MVIDPMEDAQMQNKELLDAVQADRVRAFEAASRRRLLGDPRHGRAGASIRRAARAWFTR